MYHRPVFNHPEGNTFPALSNLQIPRAWFHTTRCHYFANRWKYEIVTTSLTKQAWFYDSPSSIKNSTKTREWMIQFVVLSAIRS